MEGGGDRRLPPPVGRPGGELARDGVRGRAAGHAGRRQSRATAATRSPAKALVKLDTEGNHDASWVTEAGVGAFGISVVDGGGALYLAAGGNDFLAEYGKAEGGGRGTPLPAIASGRAKPVPAPPPPPRPVDKETTMKNRIRATLVSAAVSGAFGRIRETYRQFTMPQRTLVVIGLAVLVLGTTALVSWLATAGGRDDTSDALGPEGWAPTMGGTV